jgi:hypothetical protein
LGYLVDRPWEFGSLLAIVLALVLEFGRRSAIRFRIELVPQRKEQLSTIRDGLFVLISLLLGFTLTLAASRFADRRSLLVEEAISMGTTYLRASVLPVENRDRSKRLLEEYVDARLHLSEAILELDTFTDILNRSKQLQEQLWHEAEAVAQKDRSAVVAVYINSLNETIDLHEKLLAAFENRIPQPIWLLIVSISLIAVFTRGTTLTSRFWLTLILVPVTIAIVVGLIADLDTPGRGLIRLDHRAMQRLKSDMIADRQLNFAK